MLCSERETRKQIWKNAIKNHRLCIAELVCDYLLCSHQYHTYTRSMKSLQKKIKNVFIGITSFIWSKIWTNIFRWQHSKNLNIPTPISSWAKPRSLPSTTMTTKSDAGRGKFVTFVYAARRRQTLRSALKICICSYFDYQLMDDRQSAICFFFRLLVFYFSKKEKKLTHFMFIIVCVHFVLQLICVSAFLKLRSP